MGTHLPPKGAQQPPLFGPCLLWPNGRPPQLLLSTCCIQQQSKRILRTNNTYLQQAKNQYLPVFLFTNKNIHSLMKQIWLYRVQCDTANYFVPTSTIFPIPIVTALISIPSLTRVSIPYPLPLSLSPPLQGANVCIQTFS